MPAPPNFALLIADRLGKKGGGKGPPGKAPGDEREALMRSAMTDFLAAVKADSVDGALHALRDCFELYEAGEHDEGTPEDEEAAANDSEAEPTEAA